MNNEDLINSPDEGKHVFTPEEIQQCSRDGICVGCGLCCMAFSHKVPEKAPASIEDESVLTRFKGPGTICWHLIETREGIFRCSVQGKKDHPLLLTCKAWKGNFSGTGISDRERAEILLIDFMEKYHGVNDLMLLEKLFERGIVRLTLYPMIRTSPERGFFFQSILAMPKLPRKVLNNTDTREVFQGFSDEERQQFLDEIEFDNSNPLHREFLAFLEEGE